MFGTLQLIVLAATIVLPIALAIAVLRARRTRTATPVVRLALIVSTTWAGLALLYGAMRTVFWFSANTFPFFDVRTQPYWPADDNRTDPLIETTRVLVGGFTTAEVTASGLSIRTRSLLAAGDLIETLVTVALAALIAFACLRLTQGRPFARELPRLLVIAAMVVLVGGLSSQVLLQTGGIAATGELIRADAAPPGIVPASGLALDFWPLWAAVGLGALAVVFRYGNALERETAGLV